MFFKTKESRVFKFSSQSSGASSRAILSNSPRASFFSSVCIPEGAPSGTIRGERPSAFSKETSKTIKQSEWDFVKIQSQNFEERIKDLELWSSFFSINMA